MGGNGARLSGTNTTTQRSLDNAEPMSVSALVAAPLGTRVVDRNGVIYIKGQHELPWRREDGNGRASSTVLAQRLGARRII